MIDMSKKHQTRDGRAVRILATGAKSHRTIIGIVTDVAGYDHVFSWFPNGLYYDDGKPADLDLIPVPTKHQAWGVMRMRSRPNDIMNIADSAVFETKQEAAHYMTSVCLNGAFLVLVTWKS